MEFPPFRFCNVVLIGRYGGQKRDSSSLSVCGSNVAHFHEKVDEVLKAKTNDSSEWKQYLNVEFNVSCQKVMANELFLLALAKGVDASLGGVVKAGNSSEDTGGDSGQGLGLAMFCLVSLVHLMPTGVFMYRLGSLSRTCKFNFQF
ncbi:hypothetical protein DID78_06635 [Candidatus Marinamargulisbacteria bacterium SCGC AG-343-D04]|nr:hypothetical protein DID78_06635 [Candidatus Marinamargulisbacteria bacterium SCGC AG-343-D04]